MFFTKKPEDKLTSAQAQAYNEFVDMICEMDPENITEIAELIMKWTKKHIDDRDDTMTFMKLSSVCTRFAPMLAAYTLAVEAQIEAAKADSSPAELDSDSP